jgi:hypothetical protein
MGAIRSGNREQWVTAAERLVCESVNHVCCPECSTPSLQVRDVEYGWGTRKGVERYLICSHCGAYNAITMRHAGPLIDKALLAAE